MKSHEEGAKKTEVPKEFFENLTSKFKPFTLPDGRKVELREVGRKKEIECRWD